MTSVGSPAPPKASGSFLSPSVASSERRRHWSWAHTLALAGVPILLVETWTIVAWLTDGPHQITQWRNRESASWYAAHLYEALGVGVFLGVGWWVARKCIRERRLTFDAMFILAGMMIFWADANLNIFVPNLLFSSNFVNLNNPLGHMPFVINPDIGRVPDPLLFTIPMESVGWLLLAIAVGWLMRTIRSRSPDMSTPRLLLRVFGICLVVELLVELPPIAFGLWTYAAPAWMSFGLGQGLKLPVLEIMGGPLVFMTLAWLRLSTDDEERTVVERGLDHLSPARRRGVALLATYAFLQLVGWGPGTIPALLYEPYETQWPKTPAHLINGVCNAPGWSGTRYGPCPGSPGFRPPGRANHLPGEAP